MRNLLATIAIGLTALGCHSSSAQLIYNFDDGTVSGIANSYGGLLTASAFELFAGSSVGTQPTFIATTSGRTSGNYNAAASAYGVAGGSTFDLTTSTAFAWSLTADASNSFTVSSFSTYSRSTSSGPVALALYVSTSSDFSTGVTQLGSNLSVSANSSWALSSIGGLSYTIDPGSTVYFRLYGYGGTNVAASGNWRVDDVSINPVPEPGTVAMIALGLGVVVFGIRRRRVSA